MQELTAFYDSVEAISAADVCSLKQIRTPDKRTRVTLCEKYRQELERQLTECDSDPASGLLISCLLLLARSSEQSMVHATGKFVPQLITVLKGKTSQEIYVLLGETQSKFSPMIMNVCNKCTVFISDAVVQQLKNKDDASMAEKALEKFKELKSTILKT